MDYLDMLLPSVEYYVYRKCNADWVIEDSIIDFHDLSYVVAGRGIYIIDGIETPVAEGDIIYIPPGHRRQAWTMPDALMQIYAINFKLPDSANESSPLPFEFEFVNKLGSDSKLLALFSQLTRVWMEKEELYKLDARALVIQIICELVRRLCRNKQPNRVDERIERVKNYINENYHMPLTVSSLAKYVGLNPVYLGSLFMRCESCGIKDYINKIRVNHAYEIIRTEKLSIHNVALSCGYPDAFYFSRVFKKYIGIAPSQAQQQSR